MTSSTASMTEVLPANTGPSFVTGDTSTFEGGTLGNWSSSYTVNYTCVSATSQAHSGTRSMKITCNNSSGNANVVQTSAISLTAVAGTYVTMTLWMYNSQGTTRSFQFYGFFRDASNQVVGSTPTTGPKTLVPLSWTQLGPIGFQVGQGVTNILLYIESQGSGVTSGDVYYVDDCTMVGNMDSLTYTNNHHGSLIETLPGNTGVSFITGDASTFEGGTTGGWAAQGSSTISNSTAVAHSGTHSMKAVLPTAGVGTNVVILNAGYTGLSGTPISVGAYVYNGTATAQNFRIYWQIKNNQGTIIYGTFYSATTSCPAGAWTSFSMSAQMIGQNAYDMAIYLQSEYSSTAGDVWYFDDIKATAPLDELTYTQFHNFARSEVLSESDSAAVVQYHNFTPTESLSESDVLARISTLKLALVDSLSESDALAIQQAHNLELSETLVESDALTKTGGQHLTMSEVLSETDASLINYQSHSAALTETLYTFDLLICVYLARARSITDTLTESDLLTRYFAAHRTVLETCSETDALNYVFTPGSLHSVASMTEHLTEYDLAVLTHAYFRQISETLVPSDIFFVLQCLSSRVPRIRGALMQRSALQPSTTRGVLQTSRPTQPSTTRGVVGQVRLVEPN